MPFFENASNFQLHNPIMNDVHGNQNVHNVISNDNRSNYNNTTTHNITNSYSRYRRDDDYSRSALSDSPRRRGRVVLGVTEVEAAASAERAYRRHPPSDPVLPTRPQQRPQPAMRAPSAKRATEYDTSSSQSTLIPHSPVQSFRALDPYNDNIPAQRKQSGHMRPVYQDSRPSVDDKVDSADEDASPVKIPEAPTKPCRPQIRIKVPSRTITPSERISDEKSASSRDSGP